MVVHPIWRPVRNTTKLRWLIFRTCRPLLTSGSGQQKLVPDCCLMHIQHSHTARQSTRGPAFNKARLHVTSHNTKERIVSAKTPSLEPPEAVEGETASQDALAALAPREVAILWDLDNVQPQGPVIEAVEALRRLATAHGEVVVEFYAVARKLAFDYVPEHVREERAMRKELDFLEDSGYLLEEPYRCPVCGAKCKTNKILEKHYKQLHERELTKKQNHLNSVRKKSGKKAKKFLQKHGGEIAMRTAAHHEVMGYKKGYGLQSQLQRAGVKVRMVSDGPQSADKALEQRWARLAGKKNLSTLVLVSDDNGFERVLSSAKTRGVRTIVVGENSGQTLAQ